MEHKADQKNFHNELRKKMDEYAHFVYAITRKFPKQELYGIVSQIRRSALSVILNYIEGYARMRDKVHKNFLEMSYGSLKESQYLLEFSFKEGFLSEHDFSIGSKLADEIGAMLWGILRKI